MDSVKYLVKLRAEIDYSIWVGATSPEEAAKKSENFGLIELEELQIKKDYRESYTLSVDGNMKWK